MAPRVGSFVEDFENENLVLLGMEIWRASADQAAFFIQETGITYPLLLNAHRVAADYGIPDRNHFIIVSGEGIIVYNSSIDNSWERGWQPDEIEPILLEELAKLDVSSIDPESELKAGISWQISGASNMRIWIPTAFYTEKQPGKIEIVNTAGHSLRELSPHSVTSTGVEFMWNGKSETGTPTSSGVYYLKSMRHSRIFYWPGN